MLNMRSTSVSPYAILKQLIQFEKKIMQRLKTLEIKNEYYYLQQVEKQKGSTKQKRKCSSDTRKFINHNQKRIMSANTIMTTSIGNTETNLISTCYRRSRMNPHETHGNSRFASLNHCRKLSESHQLHHKIYNIEICQDNMVIGCSKIANRNAYISVDTGYPRSLISSEFLSKLGHRMDKRRRRPAPHMSTMVVDNMQLPVMCSISLPITINGMTRFHNLLVVHHLSRECIIGTDFIDKHSVPVKIRSNQIQFNQKNNCFTETPNQNSISIHHNNAVNLIKHNNYLSTHSNDTEQALSKTCISANVSRPNIIISNHECIQTEVINSNNNSNRTSSTVSMEKPTREQSKPILTAKISKKEYDINELSPTPLNDCISDKHNEPIRSPTARINFILERLKRLESIGNAAFNRQ